MHYITASIIYDYTQCTHKVWRDLYGPQDEKIIETNPFVQLLWERGLLHEKEIIKNIGKFVEIPEDNLIEERYLKTIKEINKGVPLIYHGVLKYKNLIGIPDLIKKINGDLYIPIDIKSGIGWEGSSEFGEDAKLKEHYALQLCLYNEILQNLGYAKDNLGIIIDKNNNEIKYLLESQKNKQVKDTWIDIYEQVKNEILLLLKNEKQNTPAIGGTCKLCQWFYSCKKWCEDHDDLTNVFELGRSRREIINQDLSIYKSEEFCDYDIEVALKKKSNNPSFLKNIGEKMLYKYKERAIINKRIKQPHVCLDKDLPNAEIELFFDIEADPTQDIIYLHGLYERNKNGKEKFIYFLAEDISTLAEKTAWKEFLDYIESIKDQNFVIYYYSVYERASYKRLSKKYPEVFSEAETEELFGKANFIDLYNNVITKYTNWPIFSYSLKDIASYLGFKWRDKTPSGALSIQWYNKYLETKDPDILSRILEYNEDDCKATMFIKDSILRLNNKSK